MLKLIFYQYRYARKQWLGIIPLLFTASLVVGTSLIGIYSASEATVTATQLFQMMIFFGGITLFLTIANIIQLLINFWRKEYRLWVVLGANKFQVSLLIAGQCFIIAFISSVIGTLCSILIVEKYYQFLQYYLGDSDLPNLVIRSDWLTFMNSVLIVPTISAVSAYLYSLKVSVKSERLNNKNNVSALVIRSITRASKWFIPTFLWIFLVTNLLSEKLSDSSDILEHTGKILFLLTIHILFIQLLTPHLQLFLLKKIVKLITISSFSINTAFWNVIHRSKYLKNLQTSITIGVTLISGFLLYIQNIYIQGSAVDVIQESKFSFVTYLAAPLLVILSSIFSTTILSSNYEKIEILQLKVLGVTRAQLILIRAWEAVLHSFLTLSVSLVLNMVILYFVNFSASLLGQNADNLYGLWLPSVLILCIFIMFYFVVKVVFIFKYDKANFDN